VKPEAPKPLGFRPFLGVADMGLELFPAMTQRLWTLTGSTAARKPVYYSLVSLTYVVIYPH
jgi:hypothetical protein